MAHQDGCTAPLCLLSLVILLVDTSALPTVVAAADTAGCNVDTSGMLSKCGDYVEYGSNKQLPSEACCEIVRKSDIECACQVIGGNLPADMSMDKVCYVASYCHNPMTPGSKCGDYTVPENCNKQG